MQRAARVAITATLAALCAVPVPAGAAQAAPPVALLSGLLTVSVAPAAAVLSASGSTVTGSLGTTTIVDGRLGATGYAVSVTTSGFDLVGAPITSSPTTHVAPSAVTARVTATTGGTASSTTATALPATPLFLLTYPSGVLGVNLASTYTLGLVVTMPAQAAAGAWTGTVTQTVA